MIGRRTGDLGRALAVLSVGCAHASLPPPRFVSVSSHEAAAAAYACEDEYELVEVGTLGAAPSAEVDGYFEDADGARVRSGSEEYVLRAQRVEGEDPVSTISAAYAGETPFVLANGALGSLTTVAPDGHGAVLVLWTVFRGPTDTTGAVMSHDGIVTLHDDRWLGSELLGFVRAGDGWLALTTTTRTTFAWHIDPTGAVTDVEDLGAVSDVVAAERGGERSVVWRDEDGLHLRAGEVTSLVLPAPPRSGWLRPRALLNAPDGYWLVVLEEWVDAHFVASGPQLHVVHVGLDGTVLGRARMPTRGELESVTPWLDGDALHVRLEHDAARVVTPVPRRCDGAPALDACAPRTFRPGAAPLTGRHWEHEGDRIHYRDGSIDWTLPLAEGQRFMPLLGDDRVAGLLQRDDGVRLLSFDHATGAVLAERALGTPSLGGACASPDLEHVALIDDTGATLVDREGHPATRIEGDFEGCALAPLRDGLAWALARTEVESSAGPITTVELLVLSRDGRSQRAHHDTHQYGRAVALLATDEGAWLGWATLGIESYWTWPLDAEGTPLAEPHRVGDLRLFPATALAMTELGPALLWSSAQEEGVVPLCHVAEGPGESTLMSVSYPR